MVFSIFNILEEEYNLTSHDDWTFEETCYLFKLCSNFSLRWHVIIDRFESDKKRTLEDLKQKFYNTCRSLLHNRKNKRLTPFEAQLSQFHYSQSHDIRRNQSLNSQFLLSKDIESLILSFQRELENIDSTLKRIEQEEKVFTRPRKIERNYSRKSKRPSIFVGRKRIFRFI